MVVIDAKLHNQKWYVKLKEKGKDQPYENGGFYRQTMVELAQVGPNRP